MDLFEAHVNNHYARHPDQIQLRKTAQSQCTGFTHEHRRCRLEAVKELGTVCKIHKNYYKDWLLRNPPPPALRSIPKRKRQEYEFQILGHHVPITYEYVHSLPGYAYLTDAYILFCKAGANPEWNKELFVMVIRQHLDNYLRQRYFPVDLSHKYLQDDIEAVCSTAKAMLVAHSIVTSLLPNYLRHIENYPEEYRVASMSRLEEWTKSFLEAFTTTQANQQVLYSLKLRSDYNLLKETFEKIPFLKGFYDRAIQPYFQSMELASKTIVQLQTMKFKEELMMRCWHPSRVGALLSSGMEVEDM